MERESGYYWVRSSIKTPKEIAFYSSLFERFLVTGTPDNFTEGRFIWIDKPENRIPEPKEEE